MQRRWKKILKRRRHAIMVIPCEKQQSPKSRRLGIMEDAAGRPGVGKAIISHLRRYLGNGVIFSSYHNFVPRGA